MARQNRPLSDQIIELLSREHLLTAHEVVDVLQQVGTRYNKTSVYRTLDKLVEQDIVCKQNFGDDTFKYELRAGHHDHLFCTQCNRVIACQCTLVPVIEINGFKVDHHHTTYFGRCAECQKKQN